MRPAHIVWVCFVVVGCSCGCESVRRIDVQGEVTSTGAVSGPITVDFFEQAKDFDDPNRFWVEGVELERLGPFRETLEVSEDIVIAVAHDDADGNGRCDDGELWAEAREEIASDETLPPLELELRPEPCVWGVD